MSLSYKNMATIPIRAARMFTRQHIALQAARRMAQARVVATQPTAFPILEVEHARGMAASESGCVESATLAQRIMGQNLHADRHSETYRLDSRGKCSPQSLNIHSVEAVCSTVAAIPNSPPDFLPPAGEFGALPCWMSPRTFRRTWPSQHVPTHNLRHPHR